MNKETSLTIISAATGHDNLEYKIQLSEGKREVVMLFEDFNTQYFDIVKEKIGSVLYTIISNLLKSRDYLGLQLNLEFGNISEEQYAQSELDFLTEPLELNISALKINVEMIMKLSNKIFNAEEISTMFNCSIEVAEKAIELIVKDETREICQQ